MRNTACTPTAPCKEAVLSAPHSPAVLREKLVLQSLWRPGRGCAHCPPESSGAQCTVDATGTTDHCRNSTVLCRSSVVPRISSLSSFLPVFCHQPLYEVKTCWFPILGEQSTTLRMLFEPFGLCHLCYKDSTPPSLLFREDKKGSVRPMAESLVCRWLIPW